MELLFSEIEKTNIENLLYHYFNNSNVAVISIFSPYFLSFDIKDSNFTILKLIIEYDYNIKIVTINAINKSQNYSGTQIIKNIENIISSIYNNCIIKLDDESKIYVNGKTIYLKYFFTLAKGNSWYGSMGYSNIINDKKEWNKIREKKCQEYDIPSHIIQTLNFRFQCEINNLTVGELFAKIYEVIRTDVDFYTYIYCLLIDFFSKYITYNPYLLKVIGNITDEILLQYET